MSANLQEFLSDLRSRGATVILDAGELEVDAPEDVISPEDLILLREHRGSLVALLAVEQEDSAAVEAVRGLRKKEVARRFAEAKARAEAGVPGYYWDHRELLEADQGRYDRAVQAEAALEDSFAAYIQTGIDAGEMRAAWLAYLAAIEKPAEQSNAS